jgi:hypothetical protein
MDLYRYYTLPLEPKSLVLEFRQVLVILLNHALPIHSVTTPLGQLIASP